MSDTPPNPQPASPRPAAGLEPVQRQIKLHSRTQRNVAVVRRWMRDTFTREQILSGLRQLAWVAPLTVLIWVWAEREQQVDQSNVRFKIEVTCSNAKIDVRLREPADGYVSVDLLGSRNRIEELRRSAGGDRVIQFEVPGDRKPGEHQFNLAAIANRDPQFEGMSVTNGSPSLISVFIDPIEEFVVPVRVRNEDQELFDGVVFDPPKVRVRMPLAEKNKVEQSQGSQLVAVADLSVVTDRTPGRKQQVTGVRTFVPGADANQVTIDPGTITVSLSAIERAKERLIGSVSVLQTVAPKLAEGTKIQFEDVKLFDVRVIGPKEIIDSLNESDVVAQVMIDSRDVGKGRLTKQVHFSLPEGVKVHPEDAKRTVEVTVTSNALSQ